MSNFYEYILDWFKDILNSASYITKFLSFKVGVGEYSLSVFSLLTLSGLLVYLTVAIIKWAVS